MNISDDDFKYKLIKFIELTYKNLGLTIKKIKNPLIENKLEFIIKIIDNGKFVKLKDFKNIKIKLNLSDNDTITDEGIKNLKNLQILDLTDNKTITDEGIKNLKNLEYLYLINNDTITDEGIKNLKNLQELYLFNNHTITNQCIKNLKNVIIKK